MFSGRGSACRRAKICAVVKLRRYGRSPYSVAVIHGGPGAPGEMAPVARRLAAGRGVLEPWQTEDTLGGQVEELKSVLEKHAEAPAILVGYSYGAMLGFILAARHPRLVKKLVMVGSGVFEDAYARDIMQTRRDRLSAEANAELDSLLSALDNPDSPQDKDEAFARVGALLATADEFDPLPHPDEVIACQHRIHDAVWPEVTALRSSGALLAYGRDIRCPVVAIHGDYDPHPAAGVREPLARVLPNFRFILLKDCGHTPWIERRARDEFFRVLETELASP